MIEFKRATARQWGQLLLGLACYGIAITLMMQSHLGLGPWDMFHQGASRLLHITPGVASEGIGLVLLLAMLPAKARFGWGTLANIALIGLVTDLTLLVVPPVTALPWQLAYYLVALPLCGLATGLYIGARMGAGPRDTLMLILSRRLGWPVRRVRTAIELAVLAGGWLMGGQAGWGTILFALGIGPAAQWGLRLCRVEVRPAVAAPVAATAE